ncbi:hypothetical protein M3Y94_00982300 [Aphelenchoides besseyi]|nr:hypothetical protein M3Y94_00982300 [Aphelenchoides besseyi]KAI6221072.1 hypothetical protein M3Y95_01002100 [Aphelenchoides besseyi]
MNADDIPPASAENLRLIRSRIATSITSNWTKLNCHTLQELQEQLVLAINEIEFKLRRQNVRVNDHQKLGVPILAQDPRVKEILRRLNNVVEVLCTLHDLTLRNPPQTVEEEDTLRSAMTELNFVDNRLMMLFSPPSSGAESED